MSRAALAQRQREVLDDLLAGRVPDGFTPAGAALTTRVLHTKRAKEVRDVAPEVEHMPGWRTRFDEWSAAYPRVGCAHDDARAFLAWIGEGWLRLHEVYDGRRRLARVGGTLYVGIGSTVWRLSRPGRR